MYDVLRIINICTCIKVLVLVYVYIKNLLPLSSIFICSIQAKIDIRILTVVKLILSRLEYF